MMFYRLENSKNIMKKKEILSWFSELTLLGKITSNLFIQSEIRRIFFGAKYQKSLKFYPIF